MSWSIRCTGHPLSDSRLVAGDEGTYEDKREADIAAWQQTDHHRSVGLDCTFVAVETTNLPVLTDVDLDVALLNGIQMVEGVDYVYLGEDALS